ncbi:MAG: hypothetical protein ACLFSI_03810, partial [Halorhodospira sp.]
GRHALPHHPRDTICRRMWAQCSPGRGLPRTSLPGLLEGASSTASSSKPSFIEVTVADDESGQPEATESAEGRAGECQPLPKAKSKSAGSKRNKTKDASSKPKPKKDASRAQKKIAQRKCAELPPFRNQDEEPLATEFVPVETLAHARSRF